MANERRRYPRIHKVIPLKVSSDKFDLVTQTKNISCNGAYCTTNKHLPVMTKLQITLLLPDKGRHRKTNDPLKVKCVGIVVRSQKDAASKKTKFNTAIFFEQIREKERGKLEEYIDAHLKSH